MKKCLLFILFSVNSLVAQFEYQDYTHGITFSSKNSFSNLPTSNTIFDDKPLSPFKNEGVFNLNSSRSIVNSTSVSNSATNHEKLSYSIQEVTVNSSSVCEGETATVSATINSPGTYSYSWTVPAGVPDPGNVASFTTTVAGTYSVIVNQVSNLCNGDFEVNCGLTPGNWTLVNQNNFDCWKTTASDEMIEVWSNGMLGMSAYSGSQFVELNANEVSTLYQNLNVLPGSTVTISFAHRGREGIDVMALEIGPIGGPYISLGQFSADSTNWIYHTIPFTIPIDNGSNYTFRFISISSSTGGLAMGNLLDNIAITTLNNSSFSGNGLVTILPRPTTPTGTSLQTFCNSATIANLTATGSNLQWYDSASGGSALTSSTQLINGFSYYASQLINGCENIMRLAVQVSLIIPAIPIGSSIQQFCSENTPTIENLTATGTGLQWYSVASGGNPLPISTQLINGFSYYATQTISGCESKMRLAIQVSLIIIPIPTGAPIQYFCIENKPTIANLVMDTNQLRWYDSPVNGNILPPDHLLSNGEVVYAERYDPINNCASISRFQVEIQITNPELEFYNLITVNNNGSNYKLTITGIEKFPSNKIQIFNRYGEIVWNSINYNNTSNCFIGKSNVNGVYKENNFLPTGTYYFVINYANPCDKQELKGFFQIDNSN